MTTKIEIANNNMKSCFSCKVKNSLSFHITEIIVILIHLIKIDEVFGYMPSCHT